MRIPRTPNAERAPKPRDEICGSCAIWLRFCAVIPGTRAKLSESVMRSWLSSIVDLSTLSIAIGKSKLSCSTRVAVTTTDDSVLVSCAIALVTKQLAISNAKVVLFVFIFIGETCEVNVYCKTSCGAYFNGAIELGSTFHKVEIFRGMF